MSHLKFETSCSSQRWLQVLVGFLQVLAGSCRFLRVLAGSCRFLRVLAGSCGFLQVLAGSCMFLRVLACSCGFLRVLAGSCQSCVGFRKIEIAFTNECKICTGH